MHSAYAWRGLTVARCLSVCRPSVTRRYSVDTTEHILAIFLPPGSTIILVFPHRAGWQYSDGNSTNGGVEFRGMKKNHDFRPLYHFISQMMQDRAKVTMESE